MRLDLGDHSGHCSLFPPGLWTQEVGSLVCRPYSVVDQGLQGAVPGPWATMPQGVVALM